MTLLGLPAFTYLRAVWSGRIGHWADTNDAVLVESAKRIEALQDPLRMIFLHFLLASNATAEQLVGYQHETRLLAPDQKGLSSEHFRRLHSTLLSYFAVVCYSINPFLREPLVSELPRVAPNREVVEKYVRDAGLKEQEYGDNPFPWFGTSYLETLATLAWQDLAEGFPGVDSNDIGRLTGFKLIVSQVATVSFDRIKAQMAVLNVTSRTSLQQAGTMARPTAVACWSCKAELVVTPESAGRKVRCVQCGTRQALPR